MPRILMTGASGGIGTRLRKLLPPIYPDLLLSDVKAPDHLGVNEKFKPAELSDLAQVEAICEGVDGILHFGGYSVEGPWTTSCNPTSSAATICSRRRGARASSAWCLLLRTMRSASIRAITTSGPT